MNMILVTGASGNVGREVVKQLAAQNQLVRALVRHPKPGAFPNGVESVAGDLNQPASLAAALAGVRGVFLLGGYGEMPKIMAEIRKAGPRTWCCSRRARSNSATRATRSSKCGSI